MAGAGSIWNTGNWHWEEKNYKQWGSSRIKELLLSLSLFDAPYTITFPEITKLTGEAAVNIRKGKTILLFEFEIEGTWKAESSEVSETSEALTGTFKIHEFNQEEMDDFVLDAMSTKDSAEVNKIRHFLQSKSKKDLTKVFQQFYQEFKELESNQKKIEEDKKRRMEEEEKRKAALVQTGDVQAKILAESKAREEAIRQELIKKRAEEENTGQGSVWNTGSYFWEEKSVSWAHDRIKELISDKTVQVPDGNIKLTVTEVHGDSSVSIRKGKKIVTYCHELKIKFEGQQGEVKAEGEIHLPDISDDSAYELHVTFTSNNPGQDVFRNLLDNQVKDFIKGAVEIFVNQLKEV